MIFVIDNYDSFTYNLVQYLLGLGKHVSVKRNDDFAIDEPGGDGVRAILISPGPGKPESAGRSLEVIRKYSGKIPILGVCLGHQAIAEAFGAKIVSAKKIMHGKTSEITTDGKTIFARIKNPLSAMRYHSLAVSRESLPDCLEISAESDDGEIMGIRHKKHLTEGIQFHPESIMTPTGKRILRNFCKQAGM
ncbi:MAG: aminodeoxychorismate/anthranilate synthase component II [Deltaproteobacteria bacterium]|nr:aminodeoxychorismate/anthranilate synthase component II [Deltaproteobacteria bacterium]